VAHFSTFVAYIVVPGHSIDFQKTLPSEVGRGKFDQSRCGDVVHSHILGVANTVVVALLFEVRAAYLGPGILIALAYVAVAVAVSTVAVAVVVSTRAVVVVVSTRAVALAPNFILAVWLPAIAVRSIPACARVRVCARVCVRELLTLSRP